MNELTKDCLTELEVALKLFGTYVFDDKGPCEVLDIDSMSLKFRTLPAILAAEILLELLESPDHEGRGRDLASAIVYKMDDWDELFDQPGILDIY
jgi:hypothetical protein